MKFATALTLFVSGMVIATGLRLGTQRMEFSEPPVSVAPAASSTGLTPAVSLESQKVNICEAGFLEYCMQITDHKAVIGTRIQLWRYGRSNEPWGDWKASLIGKVTTRPRNGRPAGWPFRMYADNHAYQGQPVVLLRYAGGTRAQQNLCIATPPGAFQPVLQRCSEATQSSLGTLMVWQPEERIISVTDTAIAQTASVYALTAGGYEDGSPVLILPPIGGDARKTQYWVPGLVPR